MNAVRRWFPQTRWSLVLRAGGESTPASRKAMDELYRAYERPLRDFARCRERDPDRLDDLLQGFFLHLLERNGLGSASSTCGRFRDFLRTALENYAINLYHAETAQKRGGGVHFVKTDPGELSSGALSPEQLFDQKWANEVIERTLRQLGDEQGRNGKGALFEALRERLSDGDGVPLREVAARLGMSVSAVKVAHYRLKKRFAELLRPEVAETVARPEDVDAELLHLRASMRKKDDQ